MDLDLSQYLTDKIQIIGCINKETLETKKPRNGNCYYWRNWQNIMLPPIQHLTRWRMVFDSDREILNRLPIVNFESWFNSKAGNRHAHGYVQTLRSYKIAPAIIPQLKWMKDRQDLQKKWNCKHRAYSEESMMWCLYARHYWALTTNHWYPKKALKARQYYLNYFKWLKNISNK